MHCVLAKRSLVHRAAAFPCNKLFAREPSLLSQWLSYPCRPCLLDQSNRKPVRSLSRNFWRSPPTTASRITLLIETNWVDLKPYLC